MDEDEILEEQETELSEEVESEEEAAEVTSPSESGGGAETAPTHVVEADRIQAATAQLQRQYDEQIAGLGVPNPYTGKPFRSFQEFQEYGKQFRREQLEQEANKQGKTVEKSPLGEQGGTRGDWSHPREPAHEVPAFSAENVRLAQREALEAVERTKQFVAADLQNFVRKFPGVDVVKLEQNPKFRKFAGKRLYREPLYELYGDFVELVSDTERAAVEKAVGRQSRSTGGAQGGGLDMLTPGQRRELEEWNRENPEMKMTPKEFLRG